MKDPAQLWYDIAYRFARQSRCKTRQVGAILVTPDQRLVAQGFNGAPEGSSCDDCPRCTRSGPGWSEVWKSPPSGTHLGNAICAHAEINLLGYAARAGIRTEGCTLYVTTKPCPECAKAIVAAGIRGVIYYEDYEYVDAPKMTELILHRAKVSAWKEKGNPNEPEI